jgi:hypothetical protein
MPSTSGERENVKKALEQAARSLGMGTVDSSYGKSVEVYLIR